MKVYLDNAATTVLDPAVLKAMLPYLEQHYGNPSSLYAYGRVAKVAIEKARKTVAELLNATPGEIFFTSGGTEGNNLVLGGIIEPMNIQHVITSPIEHPSVLMTLQHGAYHKKLQYHEVQLDALGHVNYVELERLLQSYQPALVSLMHGNNEIGNLNDLQAIGTLCHQYKALFHTDAVQTLGYYAFDLAVLPVDVVVGSGHKFHGPKGAGLVYIHHDVRVKAQLLGGSQERGMRAGTENVPAIVGLVEALAIAQRDREAVRQDIEFLKVHLIAQLQAKIPRVRFYGTSSDLQTSLYTLLSVNFPALNDPEMVLFDLDIRHIAVSAGSACASGSQKKSHVISALYPTHEGVTLRFSFSKYNTLAEVDYVVEQLAALHLLNGHS